MLVCWGIWWCMQCMYSSMPTFCRWGWLWRCEWRTGRDWTLYTCCTPEIGSSKGSYNFEVCESWNHGDRFWNFTSWYNLRGSNLFLMKESHLLIVSSGWSISISCWLFEYVFLVVLFFSWGIYSSWMLLSQRRSDWRWVVNRWCIIPHWNVLPCVYMINSS